MLAYTHGDVAAIGEITSAQRALLGQSPPDLIGLGRLAVFRDRLDYRNRAVPSALPALWIRLGQVHRAEALAHSISEPHEQVRALRLAGEALVEVNQRDRAEQMAQGVDDFSIRVEVLAAVAEALAESDPARAVALVASAEQTAHAITNRNNQSWPLNAVATALCRLGHWDHAKQVAANIIDPDLRAWALTKLAKAMAVIDPKRAAELASEAEAIARIITNPKDRVRTLISVARGLAEVDPERATA